MKILYKFKTRNRINSIKDLENNIKQLNYKSSYFKLAITEIKPEIIRINEYPLFGNNALSFIATFEKNDLGNNIIKLTIGINNAVFYVFLIFISIQIYMLITFQSLGAIPYFAFFALLLFIIFRYNSFVNKLKSLLSDNVINSEINKK